VRARSCLSVPKYDFSWQLWYELDKPKLLPKGTKIEVVGVFDNSANNPANPDPNKEVHWGEQSWEEMMMGFFDVAVDVKMNPVDLFRPKQPAKRTISDYIETGEREYGIPGRAAGCCCYFLCRGGYDFHGDLQQGRPARSAKELPELPPPW